MPTVYPTDHCPVFDIFRTRSLSMCMCICKWQLYTCVCLYVAIRVLYLHTRLPIAERIDPYCERCFSDCVCLWVCMSVCARLHRWKRAQGHRTIYAIQFSSGHTRGCMTRSWERKPGGGNISVLFDGSVITRHRRGSSWGNM